MKVVDNIELINIDKLIPYNDNPKEHPPEQVNKIASSIKNYGFTVPIIVDKDYEIIAGHGRYLASKKLGLDEIPIIKRNDLSDAEVKALRLADNRVAESEWDKELLAVELEKLEFEEFDLEKTGFDIEEIESLTLGEDKEIEEDDFQEDINEDEPTTINLGDMIQLDNHRLLCADCTEQKNISKLMNGKTADLVFTDPPYGIKVVNDNKVGGGNICEPGEYNEIIGDDTIETAKKSFQLIKDVDKLIIWGGNYFTEFLPPTPCWIVWDKRGEMGSNNFADGEIAWTNFTSPLRIYTNIWNGMIKEGESGKRIHPTQKPVKLCFNILDDYLSNEDKIVLDIFAGSGSTLIACDKLEKVCFMMELDEYYCDVIIRRYIQYKLKNEQEPNIKINGKSIDYEDFLD